MSGRFTFVNSVGGGSFDCEAAGIPGVAPEVVEAFRETDGVLPAIASRVAC